MTQLPDEALISLLTKSEEYLQCMESAGERFRTGFFNVSRLRYEAGEAAVAASGPSSRLQHPRARAAREAFLQAIDDLYNAQSIKKEIEDALGLREEK
jgi:hypothetical protein